MNRKNKNPWTSEDERDHFPCKMEWWCAQAFLKTGEDNKRWSLKATITKWLDNSKKPCSILNMMLFDQDENKPLVYFSRKDSTKLQSAKDRFHIEHEDSFMKGLYPDYEMHFNDKKNNINLDIKYHAASLPHWIAQETTDGWLPMGLGFYRYGFIPKCNISGTMKIKGSVLHLEGKGYFEHVWGQIWYENPLSQISQIKKTLSVYSKLIGWWLHNHSIKIPNSIILSTENNPFGYDWAWALLDNGWTLYYGNILLWIMKGPAAGLLILSKDGETYHEFGNVHFHYNKTQYSKKYDLYYPIDLEINAKRGKEEIHLRFKNNTETRKYESKFTDEKYWLGFIICEMLGIVEGWYSDGKKKKKLTGICKIEPQRQFSKLGHNSLKINFLKPPDGLGISFDLDTHYLKKKIFTQLQLAPHPKIKLDFKRIKGSKINKKL